MVPRIRVWISLGLKILSPLAYCMKFWLLWGIFPALRMEPRPLFPCTHNHAFWWPSLLSCMLTKSMAPNCFLQKVLTCLETPLTVWLWTFSTLQPKKAFDPSCTVICVAVWWKKGRWSRERWASFWWRSLLAARSGHYLNSILCFYDSGSEDSYWELLGGIQEQNLLPNEGLLIYHKTKTEKIS